MAYDPFPQGQQVMASSRGVVIASNQSPVSVAGTVNIGTQPSIYGNISGSVAAFIQGNSSVISYVQNSVATVIIGGSIAASFTPPANQSVSGTVGASIIGLSPFVLGGSTNASVITVGTAAPNQSVSGTVGASQVGAWTTSVFGSVTAIQGTNPWIITGSVQATMTPAANQSVSGTVGASVIGTVPVTMASSVYGNISGSVVAFEGGAWTASVIGTYSDSTVASTVTGIPMMFKANVSSSIMQAVSPTFPLPINGSVSGTVGISGTPSISGTVLVGNAPSVYGNISGSVVAFQGGTQITSIISSTPSSVLVGSSIFGQLPAGTAMIGSIAAYQGSIPWIITGSVQTAVTTGNSSVQLLGGSAVIGSVATLQGTNPWITVGSVYGNVSGSVVAFQGAGWSGSVVAFQGGTQITSVSGTVTTSPGADTVPAITSILVGVTANTNGSVATTTGYQMGMLQITSGPGASITGAINFEGTVDGTQFVPIQGYNISTNVISSMATAEGDWAFNVAGLTGLRARVSNWSVGSITARLALSPEDARPLVQYIQNPSIAVGIVNGGVVAGVGSPTSDGQAATNQLFTNGFGFVFNGSNWDRVRGNSSIGTLVSTGASSVITINQSSSILSVPVGSTIALLQSPSIVGTYSVAATYAATQKAVATMGIRNDTLASIASADLGYTLNAIGPSGETIVANAPFTKWVQGTQSILGPGQFGPSVIVLAAQGSSIFTYVTGVQVTNATATSTYVTFYGATSSVIGYTVVPANGGSNIVLPNAWKSNANGAITASIGTSNVSVFLAAQGFISKV